jgi:hypothetical protein
MLETDRHRRTIGHHTASAYGIVDSCWKWHHSYLCGHRPRVFARSHSVWDFLWSSPVTCQSDNGGNITRSKRTENFYCRRANFFSDAKRHDLVVPEDSQGVYNPRSRSFHQSSFAFDNPTLSLTSRRYIGTSGTQGTNSSCA